MKRNPSFQFGSCAGITMNLTNRLEFSRILPWLGEIMEKATDMSASPWQLFRGLPDRGVAAMERSFNRDSAPR
jgi:hypothetical protein